MGGLYKIYSLANKLFIPALILLIYSTTAFAHQKISEGGQWFARVNNSDYSVMLWDHASKATVKLIALFCTIINDTGNRIIYNSKRNTVKYCKAWQGFFVFHGILQIIVYDAIMIICKIENEVWEVFSC